MSLRLLHNDSLCNAHVVLYSAIYEDKEVVVDGNMVSDVLSSLLEMSDEYFMS